MSNTENLQEDELTINSIGCDSILFRIIQISENTEKLSEEFKENLPEIPWKAIKGMRNRVVHDYGFVDLNIIYKTVTKDIPVLHEALAKLTK